MAITPEERYSANISEAEAYRSQGDHLAAADRLLAASFSLDDNIAAARLHVQRATELNLAGEQRRAHAAYVSAAECALEEDSYLLAAEIYAEDARLYAIHGHYDTACLILDDVRESIFLARDQHPQRAKALEWIIEALDDEWQYLFRMSDDYRQFIGRRALESVRLSDKYSK